MENAVEALKLAGWVLIFILALSISMNSFSQARQSVDELIKLSDREYITTYIKGSDAGTDSFGNNRTKRKVGAATIVPSIYRAYKENYKIRIKFDSGVADKPLYRIQSVEYDQTLRRNISTKTKVYEIDLKDQNLGGETNKDYFVKRILYGKNAIDTSLEGKLGTYILQEDNQDFLNTEKGLYGFLTTTSGLWAEEQLGVYYQDEIEGSSTLISNANKTEKRVVTYILQK